MHNDELLTLIAATLTPEDVLDILGWEMDDLVEALQEHILDVKEEFIQAVE